MYSHHQSFSEVFSLRADKCTVACKCKAHKQNSEAFSKNATADQMCNKTQLLVPSKTNNRKVKRSKENSKSENYSGQKVQNKITKTKSNKKTNPKTQQQIQTNQKKVGYSLRMESNHCLDETSVTSDIQEVGNCISNFISFTCVEFCIPFKPFFFDSAKKFTIYLNNKMKCIQRCFEEWRSYTVILDILIVYPGIKSSLPCLKTHL